MKKRQKNKSERKNNKQLRTAEGSDARRSDRQRDYYRSQKLQALHRNDLGVEHYRVNEAVHYRAEDYGDDALRDRAAAKQSFADNEAGKADDDNARAGIYVHGFLILADYRAGERGQRVCDAEADGYRKVRV